MSVLIKYDFNSFSVSSITLTYARRTCDLTVLQICAPICVYIFFHRIVELDGQFGGGACIYLYNRGNGSLR